jgi:hypothetical protein
MNRSIRLVVLANLAVFATALACSGSETPNSIDVRVGGFAQKGPFLNGANLTLSELDPSFVQTGKIFQTTIVDNSGEYDLGRVTLAQPVVSLRVEGFFFNEVLGEESSASIAIAALTDLGDRDSANINLISHLEKPRVEVLLNEGLPYVEAKRQALGEVFAAFGQAGVGSDVPRGGMAGASALGGSANVTEGVSSEDLSIASLGDGNATLLAASAICLGYRTDSQFSELIANIAGDLRRDGTLDSSLLRSSLVGHARHLDPDDIRLKLVNRYALLGLNPDVPNFERALSQFLTANQAVVGDAIFSYPAGPLAELAAGSTNPTQTEPYTPWQVTAETRAPLKIVISPTTPDGQVITTEYQGFLAASDIPGAGVPQELLLQATEGVASVSVGFAESEYLIEVYEGNLTEPAWTRRFTPQGSFAIKKVGPPSP